MNPFNMNCRGALAHGSRIGFYKLALAKFLFGLKPNLHLQSIIHGIILDGYRDRGNSNQQYIR